MANDGILEPNIDDICRTGFSLVAGREPNPAEQARAATAWFDLVLAEIWGSQVKEDIMRYSHLEATATMVLRGGQRRYELPADFHRPIDLRVFNGGIAGTVGTPEDIGEAADALDTYGFPTPGAVAGGDYLMQAYDEATDALLAGDSPSSGLAGRYLAIVEEWDDGDGSWKASSATGAVREILHTSKYTNVDGSLLIHTLDEAWNEGEVPAVGDTFAILAAPSYWVDQEMVDYVDQTPASYGTGIAVRFAGHANAIEFDSAPDIAAFTSASSKSYRVVILRYWANLLKIDKGSPMMKRLLTDWQAVLTKGIAATTARFLDDSRQEKLREEFVASIVTLANHDYDHGPAFAGFRPAR